MACKGGRRISSTWWWLRHWAILNFLGSSQELALSKYPGNCWVKKTQKSSQGVHIRAALRLILNIAKVKISPYSTSDRSSVRGYNHIHFYHASSFFILFCAERSVPFQANNCICESLLPLKNAYRNTIIHKKTYLWVQICLWENIWVSVDSPKKCICLPNVSPPWCGLAQRLSLKAHLLKSWLTNCWPSRL